MIVMANSRKDTYTNIIHLPSFIQPIFTELLLGMQLTVLLVRQSSQ